MGSHGVPNLDFYRGRDLFRHFFRVSLGICVSSFLLHLPLLSGFGYLLGNCFRFNFSVSLLFCC